MQSVFPFFLGRSEPPPVSIQTVSSDMQRWRGYPDSPSPDVTRQREKAGMMQGGGGGGGGRGEGCASESPMADRLFLPSHPPTLAENSTAEKQSLENPLHLFLSLSSHFSSLPSQAPLPPSIPPPRSSHSLPCSVMQNRCDAYCANGRLRASQHYYHY